MRLRWLPEAAEDLEGIYSYLLENHPAFLKETIKKIYDTALSLRRLPWQGREGRLPDTR